MKNQELANNVAVLSQVTNQLELLIQLVNVLEYQRTAKDDFVVHHFLEQAGLSLIGESLETLARSLQVLATDLCSEELGVES